MREHRIPAAPTATVGEAVERARHRGQVLPLPPGAYGELATVAAPFLFDGARAVPTLPPPSLGQHTAEVLRKVGLSSKRQSP